MAVVLQVVGQYDGKQLDKAQKDLDRLRKSTDTNTASSSKWGKAGKLAGVGVAAAASAAAAGAAAAAAGALYSVKSASSLNEILNKNQVVFGKSAAGIEKWGNQAADALGMSKAQALDATGSFGTMFTQLGIGTGRAAKMSKGMVTLSADLASFHNVSGGAAEVTDMMSSAMRGEYDSIQRVIPTINAAAVQQEAMNATGKKSAQTLTDQEKATAAYALIMKGAGPAVGDMARTSDGLENVQRRGIATVKDLAAKVGTALLPAVTTFGNFLLDKGIPAVKKLAEDVMPKARAIFDALKKTVEDNRPGLENIGRVLLAVGKWVATKVVPVLMYLQSTVLRALITVIGKLGEILPGIAATMLRMAGKAVGAFRGLYSAVTGVLEGILTVAEKTLGWIPGIGDKIKAAKTAFTSFRDTTITKLDGVRAGLESTAKKVENFNTRNKLKADITDLQAKLRTAKASLDDPNLSKDRKAAIKADIANLKEGVRKAKAELATVVNKQVTLSIKARVSADVRITSGRLGFSGGMGGQGGVGESGRGLLGATAGVGRLGAGFAKRGPAWSWDRRNGMGKHDGADIGAPAGTPVYATRSGTVTSIGRGGWAGNHVTWTSGGTKFIYAHLSSIAARAGSIRAGQMLGRVGSSGHAFGAHLHVQASRGGSYVNPAAYLAQGGIVKRRPGGTTVVAGEGRYDEAVIPLPRGHRGGLGRSVYIAPGAVQVRVDGTGHDTQALGRVVERAVDRALTGLLAEVRAV